MTSVPEPTGGRTQALLGWGRRMGNAALDLVLPPRCLGCGVRVDDPGVLCGDCFASMTWISDPLCDVCGVPFDVEPDARGEDAPQAAICGRCQSEPPPYAQARAVLRYDAASSPLILKFKHGDRLDAVPSFSRWMARAGTALITDAPILLPVPLHPKRLAARRYNQAALLSSALARHWHLDHDPRCLVRIRPTGGPGGGLGGLGRAARRGAVKGAFAVIRPERIRNRTVLLIDDVHTTGATLESCVSVLLHAGAQRVNCLTLAHVLATELEQDPQSDVSRYGY